MTAEVSSRRIDLLQAVDRQKIGAWHIAILLLCASVMCVDGFDVFIAGAIAPSIAAHFGKPAAAMTLVFLCQQFGIAMGAIVMGPISDRYGRRRVLLICTLCFGLLTLGAAFSANVVQLAIVRGLSGVFLSGVFPIATTFVSEFTPKRLRARFLSLVLVAYAGLGTAASAVAASLIGRFTWQDYFIFGGAVPLLLAPLIILVLPESMQFRARRNPGDPSIAATLRRLAPRMDLRGDESFEAEKSTPHGVRPNWLDVMSGCRAVPTFILWATFFFAMGNGALVTSWLPSFFKVMAGIPIPEFGHFLFLGSIGAIVGTVSMGAVMDRFHPIASLMVCYAIDAAALLGIGILSFGSAGFALALFAMYSSSYAGTTGQMLIVTAFYPLDVRATGFGWCIAAGRFGSIVGPLLGGAALAAHLSLLQTLTLMSFPPLAIVVLIYIFRILAARGNHALA